tara:strand:+ start:3299 stop:3571 length:273 start_codon:yes stop_codon:yes gene_type:complete
MADDGNFNVTAMWAPIELNGVEISDGIFTITSRGNAEVLLMKKSTTPSPAEPGTYTLAALFSAKYELSTSDRVYAKTTRSSAIVGVVPAG